MSVSVPLAYMLGYALIRSGSVSWRKVIIIGSARKNLNNYIQEILLNLRKIPTSTLLTKIKLGVDIQ